MRVLRGEKRFLFRSAASLVKALADPGPPPLDAAGMAGMRRHASDGRPLPGLVMVGSHVPLADQQLEWLLAEAGLPGRSLPRLDQLGPGVLDQLVVADAGGTGADAGKTAQAGVEMTGDGGIQFQFAGFNCTQGVNAAAGGIHLTGQDAVAGAGR